MKLEGGQWIQPAPWAIHISPKANATRPTSNINVFMKRPPRVGHTIPAIGAAAYARQHEQLRKAGVVGMVLPASRGRKMPFVTIVGMIAGVLTTVAFLPQVLRTWRTRSTADISLVMFLIYVTGIVLWLVYGLMLNDLPLIASNAVTLVFSGTILALKLRHG
jgi:MtN3 and saliva related transmembrane protein